MAVSSQPSFIRLPVRTQATGNLINYSLSKLTMTVFSKIVSGEIPAYKVAESIDFLAFLDISPLAEGHVLVIPKKEVDYLFDLDDETYTGLQIFAKIVATGLRKAIPCKRI